MNREKLVLGTVQFGLNYGISNKNGQTPREEAFLILDSAAQSDVRTLDTAYSYGEALEVVGDFHRSTGFRFNVNSKFKAEDQFSVSQQLYETLDTLKIEKLDTFFYHRFSELHSEQTRAELNELKSKHLIGKVGVSIYNNAEFSIAINDPEIDVIQTPFNLLDNFSQRGSLIDQAHEKKKIVQARSIFLQGLFFLKGPTLPDSLKCFGSYLEEISAIALELELSIEELALSYVISQHGIHHVLIGVNNRQQLEANLRGCENGLPKATLEKIDQIDVKEKFLLNPQNW